MHTILLPNPLAGNLSDVQIFFLCFLWSHTVEKHGSNSYLHCILFGIIYSVITIYNKASLVIYSCE
jgi:hypothetical protein